MAQQLDVRIKAQRNTLTLMLNFAEFQY